MHKKKLLCKDMLKKAVAYILAAVTVIVAIPIVSHLETFAADNQKPYILLDDERVDSVLLNENAKLRLTAVSPEIEGSFNWQIAHPSKPDLWVNIDGAGGNKLWLTSALVSSMTDSSGTAQIRCRVSSDGVEIFSNPLPVTLSYNTASQKSEALISGEPQRRKMSLRATDSEHITYSVVINYLFNDGTIAFEPYGATIASGSNLTEPIPSPSIVGYEPYILIGDEYVSADMVYPEIYG
ncbi:MAG: hypothetical protein IKK13_02375, partial [Clostridia bacterium]|nr:hypothetical protein [Clostridia bacterium]